jgi:hypothetical protein
MLLRTRPDTLLVRTLSGLLMATVAALTMRVFPVLFNPGDYEDSFHWHSI